MFLMKWCSEMIDYALPSDEYPRKPMAALCAMSIASGTVSDLRYLLKVCLPAFATYGSH
jgi:hypothetical protein